MQPLHVTMQPLNNAEILIHCTRWITIQHLNNARIFYFCTRWVTVHPLNNARNFDSLHKVGYYSASE